MAGVDGLEVVEGAVEVAGVDGLAGVVDPVAGCGVGFDAVVGGVVGFGGADGCGAALCGATGPATFAGCDAVVPPAGSSFSVNRIK